MEPGRFVNRPKPASHSGRPSFPDEEQNDDERLYDEFCAGRLSREQLALVYAARSFAGEVAGLAEALNEQLGG